MAKSTTIEVCAMFLSQFNRHNSGVITEDDITMFFQQGDRVERGSFKNHSLDKFKKSLKEEVKQGYVLYEDGKYKYNGDLKSLQERVGRLQFQRKGSCCQFNGEHKTYDLTRYHYVATSSLTLEDDDDDDDLF